MILFSCHNFFIKSEGKRMAFFDQRTECKNKQMKKVRVPSLQGGSDRRIYVNGQNSGYYLGDGNNKIYRSGSEVSSLSVEEFAKQKL
jgi:hypothetical protein